MDIAVTLFITAAVIVSCNLAIVKILSRFHEDNKKHVRNWAKNIIANIDKR